MIDLRSDTVTRPCEAMRQAMAAAVVGDDVYGDDPTVVELEALAASMAGKEAAVFVTSGTQGNLMALLTHCGRGDEYIAGHDAHTYRFEAGGGAVLGGIQPQPLRFNERGEIPVADIADAIKPDDPHFARTRLLCLENTQGGKVIAQSYLAEATRFARERGLATHLDGARVFNAAIRQSIDIREICAFFDSVSICLSKGLGAPVGSVLVGDAAFVRAARRWRKMLGGGLRQSGILAAAGIFALTRNVRRLADDHDNAARLAAGIAGLPGFSLAEPVQTNMVMLDLAPRYFAGLKEALRAAGIVVSGQRLVTHKDIAPEDVDRVIAACADYAHRTGGRS